MGEVGCFYNQTSDRNSWQIPQIPDEFSGIALFLSTWFLNNPGNIFFWQQKQMTEEFQSEFRSKKQLTMPHV